MTIKMFFAAVGTHRFAEHRRRLCADAPADKPAAATAKEPGSAHGEIAGMLEAGRREGPARQAAQEVHEQLQEGLTTLRRTALRSLRHALLALVAIGWPQPSHAQDWPAKPVKIVVAFAPGGAADLFARLLAAEMSTTFKQQFYVENIAGSAGAIGTGQAARAQPDGYTLLIGGAGPLLTSPAINPNVGYDALRDFSHIAMIAGDGYVLISNPASKLKTFADVKQASARMH